MKKVATVFTMMALIIIFNLTVQAKEAETNYQEKVQSILNELEYAKKAAGEAYPNEYYIHKIIIAFMSSR